MTFRHFRSDAPAAELVCSRASALWMIISPNVFREYQPEQNDDAPPLARLAVEQMPAPALAHLPQ